MSDEELAVQARKVVRADVATRTLIVLLLASFLAGIGFMIVLTVDNSHRGAENRDTLHELAAQSALIRSCTTPGMPCFAEAQRRTAGAVANINRVIILAAACSSGLNPALPVPTKQDLIQTCVIDRLAERKP